MSGCLKLIGAVLKGIAIGLTLAMMLILFSIYFGKSHGRESVSQNDCVAKWDCAKGVEE